MPDLSKNSSIADRLLAIARSSRSSSTTMSDSEVVQSQLFSESEAADDLLDESSLKTVLDMIAAMETVEEIETLELLTAAQKRQVWDATPHELKVRLWHVRQGIPVTPAPRSELLCSPSYDQSDILLEPESAKVSPSVSAIESASSSIIGVGDRVVLKAEPTLSTAELKAIFEVIAVRDGMAEVKATGLGTKEYPLEWLIMYPRHHTRSPA